MRRTGTARASAIPESLETRFDHWLTGRRLVAETTAADYIRSIRHVARHAGVSVEKIRSHHLDTFLADPHLSWHTKSLRLIATRIWHRWGAERGCWPIEVDLLDTRLRQRPIPDPNALTLPQVFALLQAARSDIERRLVYPGLLAGLRPGEILDLSSARWVIGLSGLQELHVQGKRTSPARRVPVHPVLARLRDDILGVAPSRKDLLAAARGLRDPIGVEDFTPKWLRPTFAQALREADVENVIVGALLGHARLGVTADNYSPPTMAKMGRALQRLPYGSITPFRAGSPRQLRLF